MTAPSTSAVVAVDVVLEYEVEVDTAFACAITAADTDRQRVVAETIALEPVVEQRREVPAGEDGPELLRFVAAPGRCTLRYRASVAMSGAFGAPEHLTEAGFDDVPAAVLPFVNPSRYCESDRVVQLASRQFAEVASGFERVRAISEWVRSQLDYVPGSTDASSGTVDVLAQRAGVCRDFAHVAISLCRALGIPARYVSGYGVGVEPPDFHGFFEAYLAGDWWLFDPTGMAPADGLVRIGVGRDAADVPFATFAGVATLVDKQIEVAFDDRAGDADAAAGDGRPTSTA